MIHTLSGSAGNSTSTSSFEFLSDDDQSDPNILPSKTWVFNFQAVNQAALAAIP